MIDVYDYSLKTNYRRLECDRLMFVEFQCVPGDVRAIFLSEHNYIVYVQSGKKTWVTPEGSVVAQPGDAIFCKKGAHIVQNYFDAQFCAFVFFIPDDFIKQTILESGLPSWQDSNSAGVMPLSMDLSLQLYFDSVASYFLNTRRPSGHLLKLKFKELILQVITGGNPELAGYFFSLANEEKTNLKKVMMDNYLYPLSQEDFARLTNRSLSTFKRDFRQTFGASFVQWLTEMRLKYARTLLLTTDERVSEVAYRSGFETDANFIRCFKRQFGLPPHQFRQRNTVLVMS